MLLEMKPPSKKISPAKDGIFDIPVFQFRGNELSLIKHPDFPALAG
jgi:hypothetical protein